jgi:clan AA aspartic protease (TIGR02281 family)
MKKIIISILMTFSNLFICQNLIHAQYYTPPHDIENIIAVLKKEDFNSLNVLLESLGFTITKSNLNYSKGSEYVIAEIECERKILPIYSKYTDAYKDNYEKLSISYTDDSDNYKRLYLTSYYYAVNNGFLAYFYRWKDMDWTYISFGNKNLFRDNNTVTKSKKNKPANYELGHFGSLGTFANEMPKIPIDSIKIFEYGDWNNKKPGYNRMTFRNLNENFGTLCDYRCELSSPLTNPDFSIYNGDTAYRFDLKMMEYYPKYPSKKEIGTSNIQIIPLIKSGKIYYINVIIGNTRKKYVLDSGASDVTIDESTYNQLVKNGLIESVHKLSNGKYKIADGSTKSYKRTYIPEIVIGNVSVENIIGTIVPDGQPLLLGKSFLDSFKKWQIDNSKDVLILELE